MLRETCLICGSKNLSEVINLGMQPFADTFIPKTKFSDFDKAYPLICDLCNNCGQIQLRIVTPAEDRYSGIDYSYTSMNSKFSRNHWEKYAKEVSEKIKLNQNDFVIDIGSNDGYLPK